MSKNLRGRICIEDIAEAIGIGSPNIEYYLDTETGEILFLTDENVGYEIEFEEIRVRIESDSTNRYLYIPYVLSHEAYQDIENFIDSLPDCDFKGDLSIAIKSRGPFQRFKSELVSYPDVREEWFKFRDFQNFVRAKLWLIRYGIEVDGLHDERA